MTAYAIIRRENYDYIQVYNEPYAVGHDWFENGVAPYPVLGVMTGRPCFPDSWYGR